MMDKPFAGFVGHIWEEFPQLAEWHNLDKASLSMWSLDKFVEAGYHNFEAQRKPLYHLSRLVEEYAQQNKYRLLSTFEKIARYKFVEKRYQELIKDIPKVWVIADFGKTKIQTPDKIELLDCHDTDLENVWTVITGGPYGPFGFIAEEFDEGLFRGFFTLNPNVCRYAIKLIGNTLGTRFRIQ